VAIGKASKHALSFKTYEAHYSLLVTLRRIIIIKTSLICILNLHYSTRWTFSFPLSAFHKVRQISETLLSIQFFAGTLFFDSIELVWVILIGLLPLHICKTPETYLNLKLTLHYCSFLVFEQLCLCCVQCGGNVNGESRVWTEAIYANAALGISESVCDWTNRWIFFWFLFVN